MKDDVAIIKNSPMTVKVSFAVVAILTSIATIFTGPAFLMGAFVGPQFFVEGLVLATMAIVLYFSLKGLLNQRVWARWLLVALSSLVAPALLVAIGREMMAGTIDNWGAIIILSIPISFAVIALSLSMRSASVWFTKSRFDT